MTPEEALSATIPEVAREIRAKKLSPVALARASLEKLESAGRSLNAVATLTGERALEEARAAEKEIRAGRHRGPLHGVPYGAKDLLATRGIPTTWGARPLLDQAFEEDATVIRRLREAGAILVAKLAMIELAGGLGYTSAAASATGPTRNPWDTTRWTCGSSSGSGAATAAGLVGFSIGSETWGSILCPSAFCGIAGLRPTYGLVPRTGAMALCWTLDKLGPMARSAEDCGLVLSAIAGRDEGDPSSLAVKLDLKSAAEDAVGYRLGVFRPQIGKPIDEDVRLAFENALRVLVRRGNMVSEVKLPDLPFEEAAITCITVEGAASFEPLITSGKVRELIEPGAALAGEAARTVTGIEYVRAMQIRRLAEQEFSKLFSRHDLIVSLTVPFVATSLDANLEQVFSYPDLLGAAGNIAGLPAISIPCGISRENLPVGLQIVGPPLSEKKILSLARLYQRETNWHKRRPKLESAPPVEVQSAPKPALEPGA